ncbi:glycosyltransferase family 4 protein [Pontibacter harenae]|uniref:glycosyltransferase family 4 protein n=1 Tax=Pontibacter harenae TaxID=2894083 RepID=UPI001E54B4B6|nr:glycosyltransferase family 4 protein [Pontibacter harenae]MCC9166596.1 glycosyltransferase family 4 protein [Pontibacter harenae]
MKVAIVHEWFVDYSGSERVVEQLIQMFPDADLFSVIEFMPEHLRKHILNKKVTTTFIQKLPFAKKHYRNYLALMPIAIEQLDVSRYDLILSSSHAVAKGILTSANQVHICYCHSPIRYAWDLYHQYLKESGLQRGFKGFIAKAILHYIRMWDYTTANRVDYFIANSAYISRRIKKVYNRDATVIFPPVEVENYTLEPHKEDFYLTASRLVPYKKIDLIVEVFRNQPDKKLIVIGEGPDYNKIKAKATSNITLLGYQPYEVLKSHLQRAKAFVFAAEEDFGIVPVEAQACGTPVIAYGKGGACETVIDGKTGFLYKEQTFESLTAAILKFDALQVPLDPLIIRENAERFSRAVFKDKLASFIRSKVNV